MGRLSLVESLALTALIAQQDARRRPRVAARWLLRYLEAHDQATIEEASLVASALAVLGGPGHAEAHAALLALAESGSRRRIGSPV
jgi:hypothetical protein